MALSMPKRPGMRAVGACVVSRLPAAAAEITGLVEY
jgi:hypothetical protein